MRKGAGDENVININEDKGGLLRGVSNKKRGVGLGAKEAKFEEAIAEAGEPGMRGLF
jgi:hypothetical protein